MKEIKTDIADIFLSDTELDSSVDFFIRGHLNIIFREKENYREYCELYAKINKLKPYALMVAHGDTVKDKWVYKDEKKNKSMQRWISSHDGKYGTLLLNSCNPGAIVPYSRKSLIWFPNNKVRLISLVTSDFKHNPFNFELFVPGHEIIDSYSIDYELKKLKKKNNLLL